jgi:hypothetical protein
MKKTKICPECKKKMRQIRVEVEGAETSAIGYRCDNCNNLEFDKKTGMNVVKELEEKEVLSIQQKLVNLSHGRIGTYFNKNIIRSLNLKAGMDIHVTVPDRKHMVIEIK